MEGIQQHRGGFNNYIKGNCSFKLKWIEDEGIRDRHKGEEIWIVGAGPQMDDFPDDFFDYKIAIAVNIVRAAFPNCTYYHWWHAIWSDLALREFWNDTEMYKRCIISFPSERWGPPTWGRYAEYPIWMLWEHVIYKEKTLAENVRRIMNKELCGYGSMNTVIHTAIQAAAVLGASKITLVGADATQSKSLDKSKSYCKKLAPFYQGVGQKNIFENYPNGGQQQQRRGTKMLADEFAKYGVEVCKYHPSKGYYAIDGTGIVEWDQVAFEKPYKK